MTNETVRYPRSILSQHRARNRFDVEVLADHAHELRARYMRHLTRRAFRMVAHRATRNLHAMLRGARRTASMLKMLVGPGLLRR